MTGNPVGWLRAHVVGIASLAMTAAWLGLLVTGIGGNLWISVLIIGYVVVVPAAAVLFGDESVARWWDEQPHSGREDNH